MRLAAAPALAYLLLAGCGSGEPAAPRVEVADAIVTLPAAAGRPGAAYFTLESNAPARLTAVASPAAGRIELHEAGMRLAPAFDLAAGTPLRFAPGGRHAMLFDLEPALRPGGRIALIFTFEGAPPVTAEAELRAPGDVHRGH